MTPASSQLREVLSDIIEGIQWAVNNGMQVANMSFGGSSDVQSMHDALISAYNAGMVLVAAAGNSGGAVGFPAAYPEVIAVSATDIVEPGTSLRIAFDHFDDHASSVPRGRGIFYHVVPD